MPLHSLHTLRQLIKANPWQHWLYFKETICSHQPADWPLWQSVASHKMGAGRDCPNRTTSTGQTPKPLCGEGAATQGLSSALSRRYLLFINQSHLI